MPANLSSPLAGEAARQLFLLMGQHVNIPMLGPAERRKAPGILGRLQSTMGGFSETELKLLAVTPTGSSSMPRLVMMVTPVVKVPRAARKDCGSKLVYAFMTCPPDWDYVSAEYR